MLIISKLIILIKNETCLIILECFIIIIDCILLKQCGRRNKQHQWLHMVAEMRAFWSGYHKVKESQQFNTVTQMAFKYFSFNIKRQSSIFYYLMTQFFLYKNNPPK